MNAEKKGPPKKKRPGKRRGPITKRENQRNWEGNYAPLVEACRCAFAFLVDEHGFTESIEIAPGRAAVTYASSTARVAVSSEMCEAPWVAIAARGVSVGLHRIIASLDPAYRKNEPPEKAPMRAFVDYYAEFVRAHAGEIL